MTLMLVSDLLRQIREPWLARISNPVGRGEEGRELLLDELKRFFDLLIHLHPPSFSHMWISPLHR